MFGEQGPTGAVALPKGQTNVTLAPPAFGFALNFANDGVVEFNTGGKWSLGAAPAAGIIAPGASVDLCKGDNFAVLAAEGVDIGVTFDKEGAKHFFTFEKKVSLPVLSLKFKVSVVTTCLSVY